MKRIFIGIGFWLIAYAVSLGATVVDLNRDWLFRTDPGQVGETSGWQNRPPDETESVNLPHTWNIGKYDSYLGKAWYFRTFEWPTHSLRSRAQLHFGATFYTSRVWINGTEVGGHEGGYTAYSFDVTPFLRATNYLAVEVDNRIARNTIPGFAMRGSDGKQKWYDWWDYGGIVRDVSLIVTGSVSVGRQQIRCRVQGKAAVVDDTIFIESAGASFGKLLARVTAFDPDNKAAVTATQNIPVDVANPQVRVSLKLPAPRLWSIDHPNLYRMVVQISTPDGSILDEQGDTFGVRTIEIRDRHLFINGERVRLTGITRHEESVSEGLAETPGTMRYDYDDMKSLQVTLTRPAHYPQNPFILDYADRHGILLIPEIPVWQFSEAQLSDPRVLALAKQQLREMIEQDGNHPSVFAWSVCNESDSETPGGIAYFRAMRDFIREIDPGRFVSYADDHLAKVERAEDSAASYADFVMMNQYFGSWHGPAEALPGSLDKVDRLFPGKMVIISEFGLPGVFAKDSEDADRMRVKIIQEQMPELARRDWIAGAIFWCYQDYKSRRNLRPGLEEGYVDHGLVDEFRQRRPSYYVWKDLNSPATLEARWEHLPDRPPTGFSARVQAKTAQQLPSYPLHDYRLEWEVRDAGNKVLSRGAQVLPDLAERQTVEGTLQPLPSGGGLHLHLTLLSPIGSIAAESDSDWRPDDASVTPAGSAGSVTGKNADAMSSAPH